MVFLLSHRCILLQYSELLSEHLYFMCVQICKVCLWVLSNLVVFVEVISFLDLPWHENGCTTQIRGHACTPVEQTKSWRNKPLTYKLFLFDEYFALKYMYFEDLQVKSREFPEIMVTNCMQPSSSEIRENPEKRPFFAA